MPLGHQAMQLPKTAYISPRRILPTEALLNGVQRPIDRRSTFRMLRIGNFGSIHSRCDPAKVTQWKRIGDHEHPRKARRSCCERWVHRKSGEWVDQADDTD